MQAIAVGPRILTLLTKTQYVPFRIQMTKRKELSGEPLDDVISIERPGLLYEILSRKSVRLDKGMVRNVRRCFWIR